MNGPQGTTGAQPCPGPCNTLWRRAETAYDPHGARTPHTIRPIPGEPHWCGRCRLILATRLIELADLYPMLEAEIDGRRSPPPDNDAKVTTSRTHPSPSAAVDDLDEILRALEAHEAAYRADRGFPPRPDRKSDLRFALCAAFLHAYLPGALASRIGPQLGRDITRLHAMARRRCATDPAKRRMPVPCSRCDLKALAHHAGERYVACENCGRLMTLDEYAAWTLELARART